MSNTLTQAVTERDPSQKSAKILGIYDDLAARHGDDAIGNIMNYGFVEPREMPELSAQEQSPYGPRYRLYREVCTGAGAASSLKLEGKDVLEIGCGRGGGAAFVAQAFLPRSMVGIDFCKPAVSLATKNYGMVPNLRFLPGDAEALPFQDSSFETVLNVESSHCYTNMDTFCKEVFRVLRPGGHFLLTDIRPSKQMWSTTTQTFRESGFKILLQVDISQNVRQSLEMLHDANVSWIENVLKKSYGDDERKVFGARRLLHEFMGTKESKTYQRLKNGKSRYMRFILQKPVACPHAIMDANKEGIGQTTIVDQLEGILGKNMDPWSAALTRNLYITSNSPNLLIAKVIVAPSLSSVHGNLHGSAIATIIDVLTTLAMLAADPRLTATVDLHFTCISVAPVGTTVTVEATVEHVGRSMMFASCKIYAPGKEGGPDRVLVATGSHTKKVVGERIELSELSGRSKL